MSSKGTTITAAKIKVPSSVKIKAASPKETPTVGVTLGQKEAIQLARNLLVLAMDAELTGDIRLTAHPTEKRLTILRNKTWQKGVDGTAAAAPTVAS